MTSSLGLSTYQWNNNIKSIMMLAAFPGILLGIVALFFFAYGLMSTTPDGALDPMLLKTMGLYAYPAPQSLWYFTTAATLNAAPIVFGIACLWIVIGMAANSAIINKATGAKPLTRKENPEIYNLLETLCISRGMRMPKLFLIETPALNAYASGISEGSFAVTVTRGLIDKLNKEELQAVLAHELAHIINRDVRLLVFTLLFTGMLAFVAEMIWRNMAYSNFSSRRDKKGGGVLILLVAAGALMIGYGVSMLFRFALSRKREYLADAGAVELTKRPDALIRALQKISGNCDVKAPSGVKAMMIETPPGIFDLFNTHPPIEARVSVLRRLGGLAAPV